MVTSCTKGPLFAQFGPLLWSVLVSALSIWVRIFRMSFFFTFVFALILGAHFSNVDAADPKCFTTYGTESKFVGQS